MIRHFFRLVWNRRRTNGWIMVELLFSFLVLCGVLAVVVYNLDQWRRPMGFSHDDVWSLGINPGPYSSLSDADKRAVHERVAKLKLELSQLSEIELFSSFGYNVPFGRSRSAYVNYAHGMREVIESNEVDPEARNVLRLELLAGRWLEQGDGELNWTPVVISQNYAELLFGREDPIGKPLTVYKRDGSIDASSGEPGEEKRIVGVIRSLRRRGECRPAVLSEFRAVPSTIEDLDGSYPTVAFLFRVRPGTTAALEERLLRLGHGVAPEWSFTVTVLEDARRAMLRDIWLPLLIGGVVAGFLIVMVGLGLVGVLWQTIARRRRELGLRRALGATAAQVRGQVLGELLALTTLAVFTGTLIFLQAPLLGVFGQVGLHIYLIALALGWLVIYPFVILCGLYPSWLATRVRPVEALQYE